jgi:hypothetical protein
MKESRIGLQSSPYLVLVAGEAVADSRRDGIGSGTDQKGERKGTHAFPQARAHLRATVVQTPVAGGVEPIGGRHAPAKPDGQHRQAALIRGEALL